METQEDMLDTHKEDYRLNNVKALIILDKITKELHSISQELSTLNKILRRK